VPAHAVGLLQGLRGITGSGVQDDYIGASILDVCHLGAHGDSRTLVALLGYHFVLVGVQAILHARQTVLAKGLVLVQNAHFLARQVLGDVLAEKCRLNGVVGDHLDGQGVLQRVSAVLVRSGRDQNVGDPVLLQVLPNAGMGKVAQRADDGEHLLPLHQQSCL